MAMKKFGGATVSPKEMREYAEQKKGLFDQHYVAEYDYEKDRYRKRKEYEYERRVREMEEQLREQMRMNQPQSAQEAAIMQRQAAEQLQMAQREAQMRAERDMAMAYPGNYGTSGWINTSGSSNVMVGEGAGSSKKKSETFNWNRPFRAALQDETDAWLKDVLKAA